MTSRNSEKILIQMRLTSGLPKIDWGEEFMAPPLYFLIVIQHIVTIFQSSWPELKLVKINSGVNGWIVNMFESRV